MPAIARCPAAIFLPLWLVGCGSSVAPAPGDASSTGGTTSMATSNESSTTGDDVAGELAQLEVLRAEACRRNSFVCMPADDFRVVRLRAAIEAGRLEIDDALLADCMASDQGIHFDLSDIGARSSWTECIDVFVGGVAPGDPCDVELECQAGHYCLRDDYGRAGDNDVAGGCGVCVPQGGIGTPCNGHGWTGDFIECLRPLVCEAGACSDGAGPPRPGEGEPCPGSVCEGELLCIDNVCTPRRSQGGACTAPWECGPGLTCEDSICEPASAGDWCVEADNCPGDLVCVDDGGARDHCEPSVPRGEPCAADVQCPADHACLDGVCGRVAIVGESCSPPDACAIGMECIAGACEWLPLMGEPCTDRCARGSCIDGTCQGKDVGASCEYDPGDTCGMIASLCDLGSCVPTIAVGACGLTRPAWGVFCDEGGEAQPICVLP